MLSGTKAQRHKGTKEKNPPACAAIIAAGGSGVRMGAGKPKQFLEVAGKTILRHCLEVFLGLEELRKIVVVLPRDSVELCRAALTEEEIRRVSVVPGGPTRQESVYNGLLALESQQIEVVAIHDAARPLVSAGLVRSTLQAASGEKCGAVACQPVLDTVKQAAGDTDEKDEKKLIESTVDRKRLWLAQTPQAFRLDTILEAHRKAQDQGFQGTDDSSLCERLGIPVRIVPADSSNVKVTSTADLKYLEYCLKSAAEKDSTMNPRIGEGYDIHRLVKGRRLMLGGITIPHDKGLLGHSDADVLLHAVADSLLGAAALGDIGTHFPDTDESYRDTDSAGLLARVVSILAEHGFEPYNVDTTVIAQKPRLAPYIEKMRGRIAKILSLPVERVSVKATTHEGLGPLGHEQAIAARACSLIHEIELSQGKG
ncbi:MAG: 2-C-methyl-D-erythritol 4-phosphate cytidylyltransferase [Gemmatimonadota bacterium]|nr:2-C-methyl-D-erythritol 4-phosphate cytidylyltransferase [Gemmatimonadota bacterium]